MNRPSYKKLYLEEKSKTRFSYDLLTSIVKMLNEVGMEAEVRKRQRYDSFGMEVLFKVANPNNELFGVIGIDEDLLEGSKEKN